MRTLLYIALIFGVLLPSATAKDWDLEKMRQCTCTGNATNEIPTAVARGCITDTRGKESHAETVAFKERWLHRQHPGQGVSRRDLCHHELQWKTGWRHQAVTRHGRHKDGPP
ncbi:unnamed protein product [Staurois parvus]|uniref:Secreted protein n=1 Tax=Staurois parvus TaxID=386267 RepID=A0ABN9GBC7_9NEOB|nr:unnamed protein product [Staurois parvus]